MRRQLNFQLGLDIERVHLFINMKCDVQVWWKSGKRKISTKNPIKLLGSEQHFDVNEKLNILAKIDVENGVIKEKKTELLILLFTSDNSSKLGGKVYLNLADFIDLNNLGKPITKKLERRLQSCPDELSKIIFSLTCKYFEDDSMQSLHDISFQANNLTNNMSRSNDMTFRPEKQQSSFRRQSVQRRQVNDRRESNILNPPSSREYPKRQSREKHQQRPMQFSFNPLSQAQRQRLGLDNSELIRDLKQIIEQKNRDIKNLQQDLHKLKTQSQQKASLKSLALINQLNSVVSKKQLLERQKVEMISQNDKIKEEKKLLEASLQKFKSENSAEVEQLRAKLEQRKKMIEQLNKNLEDTDRRAHKYQDELFKIQNQFLSKEKQHTAQIQQKEQVIKEQADKLKNISLSLQDLKTSSEILAQSKLEIERKAADLTYNLHKKEEQSAGLGLKVEKLEVELQKEREIAAGNYRMLEEKFKEREKIIHEIQSEFSVLANEKSQQSRQKDEEISMLREKFNASCRKIDQMIKKQESQKNQISELNVRVSTLQKISEQLEKDNEQKQQTLLKAKEYIKSREQQIIKRDEFIAKVKAYMETKEQQFNTIINSNQSSNVQELNRVKRDLSEKERMLEGYISDRHKMEKKMEDMEGLIDRLKDKIVELEDGIDELYRKNEGQEETLKDLVKKNLDMEVQLNIKDYQIQRFKVAN